MNPDDAFARILESLHRAALEDALWPAAATLVEEAIGARGSTVAVAEGFGDEARVHFARYLYRGESDPDRVRGYFDVYHARDEGVRRLRRLPHGRLVHAPDLYTEDELRTSPAYNEGLRGLRQQNGLTARFDGPDGLRIVWGCANPVGSGGWESGRLRLLGRLLPHIHQTVLTRQALAAAEALGAGLAGLLDNGGIGVVQLDRDGRVLAANGPALDILRRGEGLFDREGLLHASLPADHGGLRRLLKRALPGAANGPVGGSMMIQLPRLRSRVELHVHPVAAAQPDFGGRRVAALALVVDPASRRRIDPARVSALLGLTPSEGRVAALLAEGRAVREIAATAGYKESYVRFLLKQAYRKLGLSGQIALVRRVLATYALPRR